MTHALVGVERSLSGVMGWICEIMGAMNWQEKKGKEKEMTQEERWSIRYQEVKNFIEKEHRNPSRHRIEEHDMLNWG